MILKELFGNNARIKILEELLANWGTFLTAEDISMMAEVSNKTVYIHMQQLEKIGILDIEKQGSKKFRLNIKDERALALGLIESNEYLRHIESIIEVPEKDNAEELTLELELKHLILFHYLK